MESTVSCLINVDGINYKVDLKPQNGEKKMDLDVLKNHLAESTDEELNQYDIFNSEKYVLEIFDPLFQEFVQVDGGLELQNKTKLRVRSQKIINPQTSSFNGKAYENGVEDEVLVVRDFDEKRNIVNIVLKLLGEFVLFHNRNRNRYRNSNSVLEESLSMKERFWSSVADELNISQGKCYDSGQCMVIFFGLLSQYQYILRKHKRLTEEKVQEMWPFFKTFHHKIDCKLFAKGFTSLKDSFNQTRKHGGQDVRSHRKSECTRLEEDFNLITAVLNRHNAFKKPPRAAVWKVIGEDMAEYNSPNNRMAGYRWQKRFHELLSKYIQISSHGDPKEKESWSLYNLFSQIKIDLFVKPAGDEDSRANSKSPVPIDLSDSDSEFVVIDEITGGSDQDTPMVDLEEDETIECVQEVVHDILDLIDQEV